MSQYETLVNTLDELRKEAPPEYKRYYPLDNNPQGLDYARGRALIHLFLKVKFGLLTFDEREAFITDDTGDGGVDAYYIDNDSNTVFYVQSKFRNNEKNFANKEIAFSELLQMDVDRFVHGEITDEKGTPYNDKIYRMIEKIKAIPDLPKYTHRIILLANLSNSVSGSQLRKLTGGFATEVYNHQKVYGSLLFHAIQGTFYNPKELKIAINLSNTSISSSRIRYKVCTKFFDCEIQVLFVPTLEIAKTLYKYRNSILRYNLRSFLELANNSVNKDIAKSITELKSNEFALYNNGITMLSSDTVYNEQTFEKYMGQLLITHPQIINGGQTAYTLSRLYEDCLKNNESTSMFEGKEVLLKVIKLPFDSLENGSIKELIETISNATNFQTAIDDADRRSNDDVQIELQEKIFQDFGYFYERKRGEFADGIRYHYINRSQIIDRETMLRLSKCCDNEPAEARRSGRRQLFYEQNFNRTLNAAKYKQYIFAYKCWIILSAIEKGLSKEKNNKYGVANYGNGLRYGKYAIVTVCLFSYKDSSSIDEAGSIVNDVLKSWSKFEDQIINLRHNSDYFRTYIDEDSGVEKQELNFDNYYKGKTLKKDLLQFFTQS